MINLQKGQRIEIGLSKVGVGLGWDPNESTGFDFDLDASAFMLGSNKKLPQDEFFVFYNNQKSPDGAVESSGDDLPQEIHDGGAGLSPRRQQRLSGRKPGQLVYRVGGSVPLKGGAAELPGGYVAEGHSPGFSLQLYGADIVAAPLLQHGAFGDGARGDDPDHVPLDDALGQSRVLGLLADGHLVALGDKPGNIALGTVIGHAAHGRALLRVFHAPVPGGQRQLQLFRRKLRVIVEHFIEIAQPEKQQTILIARLYFVILSFHGRQFRHGFTSFLIYPQFPLFPHTGPRYYLK